LIPLLKIDRHNCRPSKPIDINTDLSEKKQHKKRPRTKHEQQNDRQTIRRSILSIPLKKPVAKKPTHSGSSSDEIQPSPKGVPFDQTSSSVSSEDENDDLEKSSKTGLVDKFDPPRIKKSGENLVNIKLTAEESSSETDTESDHNDFDNVVLSLGKGPGTNRLGESIKAPNLLQPQPTASLPKESQSRPPYTTNSNSPKEAVRNKGTTETRQ